MSVVLVILPYNLLVSIGVSLLFSSKLNVSMLWRGDFTSSNNKHYLTSLVRVDFLWVNSVMWLKFPPRFQIQFKYRFAVIVCSCANFYINKNVWYDFWSEGFCKLGSEQEEGIRSKSLMVPAMIPTCCYYSKGQLNTKMFLKFYLKISIWKKDEERKYYLLKLTKITIINGISSRLRLRV